MINNEELQAYSELLEANGFTIWERKHHHAGRATGFMYSQYNSKENVECFGLVFENRNVRGGYEHLMPIRPSIEHGSSMWVEGNPGGLTLEAAKYVAHPSNSNPIVGNKGNWDDPYWRDRLYEKRVHADN